MKTTSALTWIAILILTAPGFTAGEDGANVATGLMSLGDKVSSGLTLVASAIALAGVCIALGVYLGLSRRK
jgi:hypothetical protein